MVPRTTRKRSEDPVECESHCDLRCLFDHLPNAVRFDHVTDLLTTVKHRGLESGERIFSHGEMPKAIVSIRSGLLKLVDYSASGAERIVLLAGRGNVVGLEALLGQPMRCDAIAVRRTRICWVPEFLLQQLGARDPDLLRQLMSFWQHNLDFAAQSLSQFSTGPTPARIARLIVFRAAIERSRNSDEITLLSRQDMGAILGVSPENISRAIAQFKRANLLRKLKRDVYLCDLVRIHGLAEGCDGADDFLRRSKGWPRFGANSARIRPLIP